MRMTVLFAALSAATLVSFCPVHALKEDAAKAEKIGKGPGKRYAFASFCDAKSRKAYVFGGERNVYDGENFKNFEFPEDMLVARCDVDKPVFGKLAVKGDQPDRRAYTDFAYSAKTRKAYMFGGFAYNGGKPVFTGDFWMFSAEKETWEKLHDSGIEGNPPVRDAHAIAVDESGETVWLSGGLAGFDPFEVRSDLWKYDVKSKKWTEIKPDPKAAVKAWPTARYFATLTPIGDSNALLLGGITNDATGADRLYQLELKTGGWKELKAPDKPHVFHDALWHPELKKLVLLNGARSFEDDAAVTDAVLVYDPAKNAWEELGKSGHGHTYGASILDPGSGKVFTFGGLKEANFVGQHAPDELHRISVKGAAK